LPSTFRLTAPEYNLPVESRFATILAAGAVTWSVVLLAAPLAVHRGGWVSTAAVLVYQASSRICHQKPDRSFHLAGVQLPVCARCIGLYVSAAVSSLAAWAGQRRRVAIPRDSRRILLLAALPTALTVVMELAGLWHTTNVIRMLSALPLGGAAGWIFVRTLRAEARHPAPGR
jgi:uncharacterized membrane protein